MVVEKVRSGFTGRYEHRCLTKGGKVRVVEVQGKQVEVPNPRAGRDLGIGMVYQKFMLIEPLTVVENILLGTTAGRLRTGIRAAARQVRRLVVTRLPAGSNQVFELRSSDGKVREIKVRVAAGRTIMVPPTPR